ncbi:MAG: DPM/DPG synthase family glycosyltransferase [Gemmatimonadota bacterium]
MSDPGDARTAAAALSPLMRRDFAVLVPAFNEAPVIPDLVRELRRTFEELDLHGEVILVDDGSTDDTADIARREGEDWPRFRVVSHRRNLGKTEAMLTGAAATDRTFLVLFDADLQHRPEEIPRFLKRLQDGFDIVTGRKVGAYGKRAVSSVYNRLSRFIFKVPVSDLNSMKAFRREILEELTLRHDWHRFFVVMAHARGYTVDEIDIELLPRRAGESKYTGPFRIVVGVLDLLAVWFLLLFSRKPLMLFGVSGIALALAGLLVGAVAVYLRFVHPLLGFDPYIPPMGYRPLLYLVMLLETLGFLLVGFGLVSEQIAQVRDELDALRRRESS